MKNITKEGIKKDFDLVTAMLYKYSNAVYENQEGQSAHYDNQSKLVRIAVCDVRTGLSVAKEALRMLANKDIEVIED